MRFIFLRFLAALLTVLVVVSLAFAALRMTGDPINMLIPFGASPEEMAYFRRSLGLDQPLYVQYLQFLKGIPTLNMGVSFRYGEPAMPLVLERLPATMELAVSAIAVSLILAIPLGVLSAVYRNSPLDNTASFLAFLGYATPQFWTGIMLAILFGVYLGWLPTSGRGGLKHLILPVLTLATWPVGQFTRIVRSEMLEILHRDFVRTARAKGLTEPRVLLGHALRNAAIPIVNLTGLNLASLLGGTILVESVFAWPGMGRLAVEAVGFRDFPLVQSAVVVIATGFVTINFLVDVVCGFLDPRVELR